MNRKQRLSPQRRPGPAARVALEQLESRLTPAVSLTGKDLLVDNLFMDLLKRASDDAGRAYYVAQLNNGIAWSAVANQIMGSTEFHQVLVKSAYTRILARAADAGGLDYWTGFLDKGGTVRQMEIQMGSSEEFFQGVGKGNNTDYVKALYTRLLNRTADTDGLKFYTDQLAAGVPRAAVVAQVLASPEGEKIFVDLAFTQVLNRTADKDGETFWVSQMGSGKSETDIIFALATSQEYLATNS